MSHADGSPLPWKLPPHIEILSPTVKRRKDLQLDLSMLNSQTINVQVPVQKRYSRNN